MNTNSILLIVLLVIQIPSILCAIQILRFSYKNNPLTRLPNHLLVCLLIISMWTIAIDLPFTEAYLWFGFVPIRTAQMCIFYNVSFFSMTGLNRMLMAFMSIERHFLVFCPKLYHTYRSRLLFHYIPLFLTIFGVLIFFLVVNIFITCPALHFDYSLFLCGYTCGVRTPNLGIVFIWIHVLLPTAITTVASILLPIRFVIQKRTLQSLQWHRARKMIIQTSAIASMYLICWVPYTIILQLTFNGILSYSNPNINKFFIYAPYATSLLTPFIAQHTIPGWVNRKMIEQIKRRFFPQRQSAVQPRAQLIAQKMNRFT